MPPATTPNKATIISQIELFSIDNPCIGVCQSAKNGYCVGCLRSREERQSWYQMSDAEKSYVIKLLARRRAKVVRATASQRHAQLSMDFDSASTPDLFADFL